MPALFDRLCASLRRRPAGYWIIQGFAEPARRAGIKIETIYAVARRPVVAEQDPFEVLAERLLRAGVGPDRVLRFGAALVLRRWPAQRMFVAVLRQPRSRPAGR